MLLRRVPILACFRSSSARLGTVHAQPHPFAHPKPYTLANPQPHAFTHPQPDTLTNPQPYAKPNAQSYPYAHPCAHVSKTWTLLPSMDLN